MKTKELFKRTLLVLMALLGSITDSAAITYDFSAPNADGQVIYYNILDEDAQTVELAYTYDSNGLGHNVYNGYGDMVIPSTVEYNGKTYIVTYVRRSAFYRADITSVSLPNTIDSIGNGAFLGCMNLSSFTVPENVKILGGGMLSGETGVGSGRSNVNKLYYNAKYADGRRYNANLGPFYLGGCEVIIGEEVEHLPNNFLRECLIRSISIPSNVTSIGEYAFYNCRKLGPYVIIPQNVTSIGICAFSGCDSLTTVIATMTTPPSIEANVFPKRIYQTLYVPTGCLPNYVTADYWKEFKEIKEPSRIYFEDSNVEAICVQNWDTNGDGYLDQIEAYMVADLGTAFQGNSQITKFNELQYFTGLKSISDNAFQGCTCLTEITLPSNVRTIGSYAFMGCSHLASVTNLNNISTIGESAFANCTGLTSLNFNATTIKSNAFQGCTGLTSATISATTVESNAFEGCTELNTATVIATTVESNAFNGCTGLTTLNVSASTVAGDAFQGCTNLTTVSFNANSVESNTFEGCTHLTSVTLGSRVADIQEGAFRNCTALTAINIPGTVITISGGFEGCASLSNVTLNSGTKYIVNSVFQGCSSLTSITLPNGLLYIGESVFEGTGLTEINIPSSVTSIQSRAFYGCDHLTKVIVNWTTPLVVPADAFPNRTNQELYVPDGTKGLYKTADVWKDFKWIYDPGSVESYAVLSEDGKTLTFYYDTEKDMRTETTYFLNEGSNKPDWYTDNSYRNVSTVVFDPSFADARPTSTYWWFSYMGDLSRIEGIEYLNTSEVTNMSRMFSLCWSIESIDVSHFDTGNVTDMSSMFNNCEALTSLDLSSFDTGNVTNMDYMFYECCSLTSLDLSSFNTENVKSFKEMFFDCVGLNSMDLRNFDTRNAESMNGMFLECSELTSLDLSSFNTANVTDMSGMFDFCRNLQTVYVGDEWSTAAVTNSSGMFSDCLSIVGGMGTTYDANHIDKAYAHVDGGPSNPGYFSEKFAFVRGDVNGDGNVNISDVTTLIDYLLSGNASGINVTAADCNQDSLVNISDVTALIDYLLAGNW